MEWAVAVSFMAFVCLLGMEYIPKYLGKKIAPKKEYPPKEET